MKNANLHERIKREYQQRKDRNPNYSVRSYARWLGVDSSSMTKILNKQRAVTPTMFERFATRLALSEEDRTALRPESVKRPSATRTKEFKHLEVEEFNTISAWYHFAIIEYFKTKGASCDPQTIAGRLGISTETASEALDRLQALGYLTNQAHELQVVPTRLSTIGTPLTTEAHRIRQKQVLTKAIEALNHTPQTARDHSALTVAVSRERLPKVKRLIRTFRRRVNALLEQDPICDEVYELAIAFFPLTFQSTMNPNPASRRE